jgi:hypothetical protein
MKAKDVPHEKPFYEAILVVWNEWTEREWNPKAFTQDLMAVLRPLCEKRCMTVFEEVILQDEYLSSLGIDAMWREMMTKGTQSFVDEFISTYTALIIESTEKKQAQTDEWKDWAFGDNRADILATDINACMESGTHMVFQFIYNAAVKEANGGLSE